jgi:Tol biopolymer transport system component
MRILAVAVVLLALVLATACGEGEESAQPAATPSPGTATVAPITPDLESPTPSRTVTSATPVATPGTVPMTKIAFASRRDGKGEIYVLWPDGREVNVSNDPGEDTNPDWSPDGTKIAFASDRDGAMHIYVVNADGSDLTKLTEDSGGDLSPRWSPDGKRIAFSRLGSLMVMDSDGSNVTEILAANLRPEEQLCESGGFIGGWSPDGTELTFYAASLTEGIGHICIVNVDGSNLRTVVSEPPGYHVEPDWSPDGEWITYRSIREGNHEIYIVKPDGSSDTNLTNSPAMDVEPDWSPDGEWIVFGSAPVGGFHDLYAMRSDGSDLTLLTVDPAKDSDPSWSPK